ncbi:hypothetical protein C4572_04305, partial [Candidatus Parcubacteria bacterium]
ERVYIAVYDNNDIHEVGEGNPFPFEVADIFDEDLEKRLIEGDLRDYFARKVVSKCSRIFWGDDRYELCEECNPAKLPERENEKIKQFKERIKEEDLDID